MILYSLIIWIFSPSNLTKLFNDIERHTKHLTKPSGWVDVLFKAGVSWTWRLVNFNQEGFSLDAHNSILFLKEKLWFFDIDFFSFHLFPEVISFLRDLFYDLYWPIHHSGKYDWLIIFETLPFRVWISLKIGTGVGLFHEFQGRFFLKKLDVFLQDLSNDVTFGLKGAGGVNFLFNLQDCSAFFYKLLEVENTFLCFYLVNNRAEE